MSKNKYRGRELKTNDFPRVLRFFMSDGDGDSILLEQIPSLIQKLYNVAAILSTLKGFRFYGCSLLLIYDGDKEVQEHYAKHARYHRPIHDRADSANFANGSSMRRRPSLSDSRRSRSADVAESSSHVPRKVRGEVVVRIVDFAHTTTGQDIAYPYPSGIVDPPNMGKGYETLFDPITNKALARFPPHHPHEADMGFIFGIRSIVESLRALYAAEADRLRAASHPIPPLPSFDHGDVFDKLFPADFDRSYLST